MSTTLGLEAAGNDGKLLDFVAMGGVGSITLGLPSRPLALSLFDPFSALARSRNVSAQIDARRV